MRRAASFDSLLAQLPLLCCALFIKIRFLERKKKALDVDSSCILILERVQELHRLHLLNRKISNYYQARSNRAASIKIKYIRLRDKPREYFELYTSIPAFSIMMEKRINHNKYRKKQCLFYFCLNVLLIRFSRLKKI